MSRRNEITSIQNLLQKYRDRMRAPQGAVIHVAALAILDVTGIHIPEKSISYTVATKTLGVKLAGPQKSEIALHKKKILARCAEALGAHNAPLHIV